MPQPSVANDSLKMEAPREHTGRKLRMAYIGCGGVVQLQMSVMHDIPDIEVVAGCDIEPFKLDVMRDKWGVKAGYTDWNKMLKEVKPDAVCVCTPNGLHAAPTIDALRAGCDVMVEKPMAMTPRQCQDMIDAEKQSGKKLVVGFQFRYHPTTEFLARARDEGRFGKVMFVKCQALRRRGIPNWGVFGRKELQGGGPMIDIGVHVIEMAHYVMGSPKPVAASGNTWTFLGNKPSEVVSQWPGWDYKTYTVEDLAIGQIRFDNGAIMQIEAAFAAHIEKDVWNFTLTGDQGGCSFDPPLIFTDRAGTMINVSPAWLPKDSGFLDLFRRKLTHFKDVCLNGEKTIAPGQAGLDVQKILDGVYRSAEAGREVTIE